MKFQVTRDDVTEPYDTSRDASDVSVHLVTFTPEVRGEYVVKAWFNDTEIRGTNPANKDLYYMYRCRIRSTNTA